MTHPPTIEIANVNGWRKTYQMHKHLVHVGSDPGNDLALDDGGRGEIAPRHLQVILLPEPAGYRVVNVGDGAVFVGPAGDEALLPRAARDVADGECVQLGDFTLTFRVGDAERADGDQSTGTGPEPAPGAPQHSADSDAAGSGVIGLTLSLSQTALGPDQPIEGTITVRNQGRQTGVKFDLALEGLPIDCYDVGPGPILFPSAARDVPLRLIHPRRPEPPAGPHRIRIQVTAPEAYPGEQATAAQTIDILPFYDHEMSLTMPEVGTKVGPEVGPETNTQHPADELG
ncbi:MAG TPA: hypothetical protein ENN19_17315 [Chloroflexi bacterium]|nr:hypothetical protein [Chloroflexota bacterium]